MPMKMQKLLLAMLCFLVGFSVAEASWEASDGVYYLKATDGLESPFEVDGEITFKAVRPSASLSNRDCGVVFVPKNAGEVIQITVEEFTLDDRSYLCVYDGAIEKIGSGVSDGVDQSRWLPAGWKLKLAGDAASTVYQSLSADGKLSFGFHGYANASSTFTIKVRSVVPKDMEYVSSAPVELKQMPRRGAVNQAIFAFVVKTEGVKNPIKIDNLAINCSALSGTDKLKNVRLYKGKVFNESNLLASAQVAGDALGISDFVLQSGENLFNVVADMLPDASGNLPVLVISNLKINGIDRTVATVSLPEINITNEIRISDKPQTYTIGESASFFDDGGPDGTISENFEGTVTFVPKTPGYSIKIDFSELALFNTSSTGKNDIFKFYNGRTADDANLITTLLKEKRVVKSAASDGSMTVTLKSTTGIPANGWKAIVSQFVPSDMKVVNTIVEPDGDNIKAYAGEQDVRIAYVNVKADNTLNPLVVKKFVFDSSSFAPGDSVRIRALGENKEAEVKKLVGSGSVASSFEVKCNYELSEGDNWFMVTADMKNTARNDEKFTLSLSQLVAGDSTLSLQKNPVDITVENIFKSKEGRHIVRLHDIWGYTHTKSDNSYSDNYAAGNKDQIVTFMPVTKGSLAQIDIESFDLYYSTSSYQPRSKFIIYSGSTCSADSILWQLDDAENKTVGPGRILRSNAADGAMTVLFNPNTTYSSYCAKGWNAIVKEYRNHDMTVEGVDVRQTTTNDLPVGATGAPIIDFSVSTEGTLTVKKINGFNFKIKGATALDSIKVYTSANSERKTASLFGSAGDVAENLTVKGDVSLIEGENYFWVEADVKNNAEPEVEVDAALLSYVDSGNKTESVQNGDPEGARLTKNIILLEEGEHKYTITKNVMFYDDGGAENNISPKQNAVFTFVPADSKYAISLDAKDFTIGNGNITVYSGQEVDDSKILGKVTGYSTTSGMKNLVSKASDGSVTLKIKAPTGTTLRGFAIEVGLHEKVDYSLSSAAAEKSGETFTLKGASDVLLQTIKLNIEGDKGASKLSDFKFDFTGTDSLADVKSLKLYYAGHNTGFDLDNATLIGSVKLDKAEVIIPDRVSTMDNGEFTLFVIADISDGAIAGHKIVCDFKSLKFNNVVKDAISSDKETLEIRSGMKGTYTIGGSETADFKTFKEAVTELKNKGIEDAVTFEIEPGTYKENVEVSDVKGTSALHTVTFKSKTSDKTSVTIKGAYSYADKNGVFRIYNSPYVVLRDLTFNVDSKDFTNVVHVGKCSHHVSVIDCDVTAPEVTSGYTGTSLLRTQVNSDDARNNDGFIVENSRFEGGYIALYLGGTSIVANPKEKNVTVRNNTVSDAYSMGIYVSDYIGALIENNVVTNSKSTKKGYVGINVYRLKGKTVIRGNRVINSQGASGAYSTSLSLRQATEGSENEPVMIYNNEFIVTQSPNVYARCVEFSNDCKYINLIYNTMRIAGTQGYAIANSSSENPAGILLRNNIIDNTCDGGAAIYLNDSTNVRGVRFDHNAINSKPGIIVKSYAPEAEKFATFVSDTTNIFVSPKFLSEIDSHITAPDSLRSAIYEPAIDTDITGTSRSHVAPTIGAYEYVDLTAVKPVIADGYPKIASVDENTASVTTKWNTGGKLYAMIRQCAADMNTPDVSEMLAMKPVDIMENSDAVTKFTSLKPSTSYVAYFFVVSSLNAESDIVLSDTVTTARHIEPLEVAFAGDEIPVVNAGQSVSFAPIVTGGDRPYKFKWTDQLGQEVSKDSVLTVSPEVSTCFKVSITSADGQTAGLRAPVHVSGPRRVATFEDNYVPKGSSIMPKSEEDSFYSGSYLFKASGMPEYNYWYGYALSAENSSLFEGLQHQMRSVTGSGRNSSNFAVAYPQGLSIEVTNNPDGDTIPGFYITNSAYAYSSMTKGDGYAHKFEKGDWLKIIAKGKTASGEVREKEFYLADMRSENQTEHFILDTWKWFDLRSLGRVKSVTFNFDGSDKGSYGLNTPAYFCMDDFGAFDPDAGISEVVETNASVRIYPVPVVDHITVDTGLENYSVDIYSMTGSRIFSANGLNGTTRIERDGWSAGIYIMRITAGNYVTTRRILIK